MYGRILGTAAEDNYIQALLSTIAMAVWHYWKLHGLIFEWFYLTDFERYVALPARRSTKVTNWSQKNNMLYAYLSKSFINMSI